MESKSLAVLKKAGGEWGICIKYLDDGEEILSLNATKKFYAASINKVPIATAIMSMIEADEGSLSDQLQLRDQAKIEGTGVLNLFQEGLKLTVADAISLMLAQSDNTAAKLLVDHFDVVKINKKLADFGLKSTRLEDVGAGKFYYGDTTASESSKLLSGLASGSLLGRENSDWVLDIMKNCHMNWGIARYLPRQGLDRVEISSKEGTWEDHRHEVGIVWAKKPYILCAFSSKLDDQRIHVDNTGVIAIAELSRIIYEETNG